MTRRAQLTDGYTAFYWNKKESDVAVNRFIFFLHVFSPVNQRDSVKSSTNYRAVVSPR